MRITRQLFSLVLVFALVLTWAGTTFAQDYATPGDDESVAATVFVRQDPALGSILTDPAGMTLYLFTKDTVANQSVCEGDCLANWPAFTAEEPLSLPEDVDGELTSFDRGDGTMQVAYNGIPLYYFAKDTGPGDVNGQGVGDVWYVVHPGEQMGVMATPEAMTESSPEAMEAGTVTVNIAEYTIDASATEFKVGQEYTFEITNGGLETHEFYIEKAGAIGEPLEADGAESEVEDIEPGATASLTWTFTEVGTYQLACHIPGHYEAGIDLTIHVTE